MLYFWDNCFLSFSNLASVAVSESEFHAALIRLRWLMAASSDRLMAASDIGGSRDAKPATDPYYGGPYLKKYATDRVGRQ